MLNSLIVWWFDRDLGELLRDNQMDMETFFEIKSTRADVKNAIILGALVVVAFVALIFAVT